MATLVTDNSSNNNNNAEEPVLSTKFIKQNKPRIFNLYTSSLKITYNAPDSTTIKGTIELKNIRHIYFDTDNRYDNMASLGKSDRAKKRLTIIIDISSRKYKLTPDTENDMRSWLRTLLKMNILHNKITERKVSMRGSLKSTSGLELEKSFGIPHLYDRILLLNRNEKQGGDAEDEKEKQENVTNLFVHIHDVTHDDMPLKFDVSGDTSINKMIQNIIDEIKPKDNDDDDDDKKKKEGGGGGNTKRIDESSSFNISKEDYENVRSEVFQIKLLLKGKRYDDDLSSAWKSDEWFETSEFHIPRIRHLQMSFQRKITPLAKLVLQKRIGAKAVEAGGIYVELVPLYLVPQLQIDIKINCVQLLRDDSTNKQFAMYKINVQNGGLRWIVSHRFSEFHTFYTNLVELWSQRAGSVSPSMNKSNAMKPLPSIPSKTFSKTLDIPFLDLRRKELEKFIKELLKHEWASQRPEVLSFLGFMSDHSDTGILSKPKSIHISKIQEVVNTGDIVLFKSKNSLSGLQRIATGTNWDHIGIILQRTEALYDIIEATGDGVQMYPLINRLEVYNQTLMSEIAVRQLSGNIPATFSKDLENFFDKVEGKPYELTTKKILFKESLTDYEDRSGYFCSELVAAAYEECGLLNVGKDDVNKFWPVAFAPGGHFERSLNSGFELGSVFVINCNKAEVGNARRVVGSGSNTIRRLRSNLYNSSRKATTTTKDIIIEAPKDDDDTTNAKE